MILLVLVNPNIKNPVKKFLVRHDDDLKSRLKSINGFGLTILMDGEEGRAIKPSTDDESKRYNLMWLYGMTRDISQEFTNYWANVANNLHKNNHNITEATPDECIAVSDVYTVVLNF